MSNAKNAALQIFTSSILIKIITFIGSIFLARLLFPEDYGYLLIAGIFTGFIQMFGNMGFENFYLQEKILDENHERDILNVTFKARLVVNFCLFITQFLISYLVEYTFDKIVVGELLRIYSFVILINTVTQINIYILRKKINYKPESYANIYKSLFDISSKLVFASLGFGALSFAFSEIIGSLSKMFVILYYQRFLPEIQVWNKEIFKKVFFFGKHSFLTGIFSYLGQETDKIIISAFFPVKSIGEYSFSNSQSSTIFAFLIFNQGSLLLSVAAKYKDNKEYLREKLLALSYFIAIFSIPLSISLSYYGYELITIIFGQKWAGSVDIFSLFMIKLMFISFAFPFMGLLTSFGHPEIRTKIVFYRTIVIAIISLFAIAYARDLYLYACIYAISTILFIYYQAYRGMKLMDFKFSLWMKYIYFVLFLMGLSYVLLWTIDLLIVSLAIEIILMKIALISIIYTLVTLISFNDIIQETLLLAVSKEHKIMTQIEKFKLNKKVFGK